MVSVVICTYNRNDLLKICLQKIEEFYPRSFAVEVIVVNNNSTDRTGTTVQNFSKQHSWCTVVDEPRQGLSYARNAGFQAAKHSWVLYLDDDATIDSALFNRVFMHVTSSTYKCIGGLYVPWYVTEKPKWFRDKWATNRLRYHELHPLRENEFASGGIFLIHKPLLLSHHGFNTNFGMQGNRRWYGEETELQQRLRKSGHQIAYDPKMIIHHLVPAHKMTVNWQLRSSFHMGKTYLQTTGYPHHIGMGLIALGIGTIQCLISLPVYFICLVKPGYYFQNFVLDVLKKPFKWYGAFASTLTLKF
jgi:glycosyltransferase involved in cell wall biosynthesis